MHLLTAIGVLLGCLTTVVSRFWKKFPNWLAIIIYIVAIALMIIGFVLFRKNGNR